MKLKILNVCYHRNGSGCSEGFFAVLFEDKKTAKENKDCTAQFIATFTSEDNEDDDYINAETIRVMNVGSFGSKWRGDEFMQPLKEALVKYCNNLKTTSASWSAAAWPEQYKATPTK